VWLYTTTRSARSMKKRNIVMQVNSRWLFSQSIQCSFIYSPPLSGAIFSQFSLTQISVCDDVIWDYFYKSCGMFIYGMIHVGHVGQEIRAWCCTAIKHNDISPFVVRSRSFEEYRFIFLQKNLNDFADSFVSAHSPRGFSKTMPEFIPWILRERRRCN